MLRLPDTVKFLLAGQMAAEVASGAAQLATDTSSAKWSVEVRLYV